MAFTNKEMDPKAIKRRKQRRLPHVGIWRQLVEFSVGQVYTPQKRLKKLKYEQEDGGRKKKQLKINKNRLGCPSLNFH